MLGGSQYRWNRSQPVMDDLMCVPSSLKNLIKEQQIDPSFFLSLFVFSVSYSWYECTPPDGGPVAASWELPDRNCSTVTTVVTFPWCWTGKELRTGGKNKHVAYPNGTGDDWVNCNDPT